MNSYKNKYKLNDDIIAYTLVYLGENSFFFQHCNV